MTVAPRPLRVCHLGPRLGVAAALRDAIAAHVGDRVDVLATEVEVPTTAVLVDVACSASSLHDVDVAILDVACGLGAGASFVDDVTSAIEALKGKGVTVLVVNGSTVVPDDDDRTRSLEIAALDLACLRLSVTTGISIVDADRIIAELGGDEHVAGVLEYSDVARRAIVDEVVRILEDYGWFDDRPVLAQVGWRQREPVR